MCIRDSAGGVAVDPVEMGEGATAGVVIDVDEKEVFQAAQTGTAEAVALEQDLSLIHI